MSRVKSTSCDPRLIRSRLKLIRTITAIAIIIALVSWQITIELRSDSAPKLFGRYTIFTIEGVEYHGQFKVKGRGPRFINGGGGFYSWMDISFEVQGKYDPNEGVDTSNPTMPWIATTIDPPYHIRFLQSNLIITPPLRIEWDDPFLQIQVVEWTEDGRRIRHNWYGNRELHLGPQWTLSGIIFAVARVIVFTGLWAVIPFTVIWNVTSQRRWIQLSEEQCPNCGYDCRKMTSAKCPECGWRRDKSTGNSPKSIENPPSDPSQTCG